jgi:hypothetical protein
MKKTHLSGLIFLFFSLISFGQTTQKNTVQATKTSWKVLKETKYSIQYPDNWELNKSGQMGSNFVVFSKLTSPQDKFRENINLIIQNLQGQKINLNKYVEISEGQIKTMITNGNLIESKRLNQNGHEFQKVIYTGDQGIYKLKFEQYYWVLNGQAYVLTLTCEKNQFNTYKLTGEKILNSFRLN